jgi:hypothetical protein
VVNDGTLNSGTQTTTVNITTGSTTASPFSPTDTSGTVTESAPNAVDLGAKFQSLTNGTISGTRFYKGPQNTGNHIGDLWTISGTLLARPSRTRRRATGRRSTFRARQASRRGPLTSPHTRRTARSTRRTTTTSPTHIPAGRWTAPSSSSSGGNGFMPMASRTSFPTIPSMLPIIGSISCSTVNWSDRK